MVFDNSCNNFPRDKRSSLIFTHDVGWLCLMSHRQRGHLETASHMINITYFMLSKNHSFHFLPPDVSSVITI